MEAQVLLLAWEHLKYPFPRRKHQAKTSVRVSWCLFVCYYCIDIVKKHLKYSVAITP